MSSLSTLLAWDSSSLMNIPEEKQERGKNWDVLVKGGREGKRERGHETLPDPTRSMRAGVWQGRREPVIGV